MEKMELPCINCITLPICKALRNETYDTIEGDFWDGIFIVRLIMKCKLIEELINMGYRRDSVLKFFNNK